MNYELKNYKCKYTNYILLKCIFRNEVYIYLDSPEKSITFAPRKMAR